MTTTTIKTLPKLVKQFSDKMALPNHGFSPVSAITRLDFPQIPVPKSSEPDRIIIKNPRMIKEKLRRIKREGLNKFKIVSDFDQTLTKSVHNKRSVEGSFSVLRSSSLLREEVRKKIDNEFTKYKESVSSIEVDKATKFQNMDAWIQYLVTNILNEKLHIDCINKTLQEAYFIPRPRLDNFLQIGYKFEVPFYIISAGTSTSMLDHYVKLENYSSFHLYANEMLFDQKGYLSDFSKPFVHSYVKNDIFQRNQRYRRNILLLGDLLHVSNDANTAKNIIPKSMVSIGYLNYATGYSMRQAFIDYARKFDIVIITDESLALPELILKYILDIETEKNLFDYLDDHTCHTTDARNYITELIEKIEN